MALQTVLQAWACKSPWLYHGFSGLYLFTPRHINPAKAHLHPDLPDMGQAHHTQAHSNLHKHIPTQTYQTWDKHAALTHIKPAKAHPAQTYQNWGRHTTTRTIKPTWAHPHPDLPDM